VVKGVEDLSLHRVEMGEGIEVLESRFLKSSHWQRLEIQESSMRRMPLWQY
jgi:hypothetical protein